MKKNLSNILKGKKSRKLQEGITKNVKREVEKDLGKNLKKGLRKKITKSVTSDISNQIDSEFKTLKGDTLQELNVFKQRLNLEVDKRVGHKLRSLLGFTLFSVFLLIGLLILTGVIVGRKANQKLEQKHAEQLLILEEYVNKLEIKLDSIGSDYKATMVNQVEEEFKSEEFRDFSSKEIRNETRKIAVPIIKQSTNKAIDRSEQAFNDYLDSLKTAARDSN